MSPRVRVPVRLGMAVIVVLAVVAAIVVLGREGSTRQSTPTGRLSGVDVSSHNSETSWRDAARSGLRFVFARATEGNSGVDAKYPWFKEEAKASGVAFSAYHFSHPDRSKRDARKEADHFLSIAGLGSGDLVPILDVEDAGGLGVEALQSWVRTWLEEVVASLGVKPVIYTSPSFWQTYLGDTTYFADAGYKLDIASWGGDGLAPRSRS